MSEDALRFELPKNSPSIIKVLGAGGGGSNAVNHMFRQGIKGVDFIICNTDHQALESSPVPHKVQLGISLTEGNGAGSKPEVGMNSAIESIEEVRSALGPNTKMLFITAGMGGGTGTGAAPIIAQAAREMGILTVGIVTMPFMFEGRKRQKQAEEGIAEIRNHVDTLLVINNDKLRLMYGNLKMSEAFEQADNVLTIAARGIAEIITRLGHVNVDFEDVKTVMQNSGAAIMGSAQAAGESRAVKAVQQALASPLLNDNDISGARHVLLNMEYGSEEITMDEIAEITDYIQEESGMTAEVIWGYGQNDELAENLSVTIIATGFEVNDIEQAGAAPASRKVTVLDDKPAAQEPVKANTVKQPVQEPVEEPFIVQKPEPPQQVTVKFDEPVIREQPKPVEPEVPVQAQEPESAPVAQDDSPFIVKVKEPEMPQAPSTPVSHSEPELRQPEQRDTPERAEKSGRGLDRLRKLSDRFRTNVGMAEMENVPAYQRRQIRLNDVPHSSESQVSRFTLTEEEGPDGEKRMDIKPNNSFLHDNVD